MTLYRKELGRVLRSLVYLIAAVGMVAFAFSQGVLPPDGRVAKPQPGMGYGMKASGDPALIMPQAAASLGAAYAANEYATYPHGFHKTVRLGEADKAAMGRIVAGLAADGTAPDQAGAAPRQDGLFIAGEDLQADAQGNFQVALPDRAAASGQPFALNPDLDWAAFCDLMAQADRLLGGGSDYAQTWITHRFGQIPVSYEEALADYQLTVDVDRYTGAHARLFSDYMGIILALLAVFPAVFLCLKDGKHIAPTVYTRRVASAKLVLARYLALVTALMLPVVIMGAALTVVHGMDYGFAHIDALAYLKYALGWIMPTVMAATGVGMLLTTLTGTPVAIAVMLLGWFGDMMGDGSAYEFVGVRPLQLAPRHNALGQTGAFQDYLPSLVQNRLLYAAIALALVALTIAAFDAKRRGWLHGPMGLDRGVRSEG